jgi:hypothetical protein
VLELTYNYGRTEYTKGNGYAQVTETADAAAAAVGGGGAVLSLRLCCHSLPCDCQHLQYRCFAHKLCMCCY